MIDRKTQEKRVSELLHQISRDYEANVNLTRNTKDNKMFVLYVDTNDDGANNHQHGGGIRVFTRGIKVEFP